MLTKPTVWIDIDQVLFPLVELILEEVRAEVREKCGVTLGITLDNLTTYNMFPLFDERGQVSKYLSEHPYIWTEGLPYPEAQELLKTVEKMRAFRPRILSAIGSPTHAEAKSKMIARRFGDRWLKRAIFCQTHEGKGKEVYYSPGDIVIDDSLLNIEAATKARAFAMCIAQPWNKNFLGKRLTLQECIEDLKYYSEHGLPYLQKLP